MYNVTRACVFMCVCRLCVILCVCSFCLFSWVSLSREARWLRWKMSWLHWVVCHKAHKYVNIFVVARLFDNSLAWNYHLGGIFPKAFPFSASHVAFVVKRFVCVSLSMNMKSIDIVVEQKRTRFLTRVCLILKIFDLMNIRWRFCESDWIYILVAANHLTKISL